MSYRGPKAKLSRALGVALTSKAARIMNRRPNPPGQHGAKRRGRKSNFGEQLLEKQRLRYQYNIKEKQLQRYFKKAYKQKGNTGVVLLQLLERRLDNIVYRAGFAPTIYAARQLVTHGHVLVNGKKTNAPSFLVSLEDSIELRENAKIRYQQSRETREHHPTPYLRLDVDAAIAGLQRLPEEAEIPILCRTQMVVEYYSR